MRKRTISFVADKILWSLLYFLPIVIYLVCCYRTGLAVPLSTMFESVGLGIITDNVIFTSLSSIFGVGGLFPLFSSPDILIFFTWFIGVYIAHLFVDFLLFIPRLAHKWLRYFYKGDDE